MNLPSLLDQSRQSLEIWLSGIGQPPYRAGQIQSWVNALQPISEMSDLPQDLRGKLAEGFDEGYPQLDRFVEGGDEGADRFLFRMGDGEAVESVRIGSPEDYTACISTQVGCELRCSFCASGKFGFGRNLSSGEIFGQILALKNFTAEKAGLDGWPRHIVYMGMGEPFLNYGAVLESIRRLIDPEGPNFGARRITVSTAGMVPEIYRFAEENLQAGLAVSLHAPNSDIRKSLMPLEEVYPLSKLLPACRAYIEKTGRRLTFEYVLLKEINDSPREAKRLVELFREWKLVHINLIRYNPIGLTRLRSPKYEEAAAFLKRLQDGGIKATLRKSPGRGINAACGQLRGLEYEKAGITAKEESPKR
jgi:23S rRNA (adenine2503-C2)-methyltransferase